MKHCITQLLCQGLYVQGNKQFLLLWAALGDHPLRRTVGIHHLRSVVYLQLAGNSSQLKTW
jgi:hypothetical protein